MPVATRSRARGIASADEGRLAQQGPRNNAGSSPSRHVQPPAHPPHPPRQRVTGGLLHLLNDHHVDPISCRRVPLSAPPAPSSSHGIGANWNGVRAPLIPPTPVSGSQGVVSVAPPPSDRSWRGILTPNAFLAEHGGQVVSSVSENRVVDSSATDSHGKPFFLSFLLDRPPFLLGLVAVSPRCSTVSPRCSLMSFLLDLSAIWSSL